MNILFVCSANLNRSPTFEKRIRNKFPEHNIESRGIYFNNINNNILKWADKVFVMDLSHEMFVSRYYPKYLNKVVTVGISDQYDPDDPELLDLIDYWLTKKPF